MKAQWKYVEKDGNPKEPGVYWVTLIYPAWVNNQCNGKYYAEVCLRYFADLDKNPELKGWIMNNEPETGMAWTEECGSIKGERVHAWMPMETIEIADLPAGVEKI